MLYVMQNVIQNIMRYEIIIFVNKNKTNMFKEVVERWIFNMFMISFLGKYDVGAVLKRLSDSQVYFPRKIS